MSASEELRKKKQRETKKIWRAKNKEREKAIAERSRARCREKTNEKARDVYWKRKEASTKYADDDDIVSVQTIEKLQDDVDELIGTQQVMQSEMNRRFRNFDKKLNLLLEVEVESDCDSEDEDEDGGLTSTHQT